VPGRGIVIGHERGIELSGNVIGEVVTERYVFGLVDFG